MAIVRIDGTKITDWASFHIVCKEAFGFPSFYGENMDAFIDCLTYIDKGDGMSRVVLSGDEMSTIEVTVRASLRLAYPKGVRCTFDSRRRYKRVIHRARKRAEN